MYMAKGKVEKQIAPVDFASVINLRTAFAYLTAARARMQNAMSFITKLEVGFMERHGDDFLSAISETLRVGYSPGSANYYFVPKTGFGLRPMAVLPLGDAITYQAILNPLVFGRTIDRKLQNGVVFANRVSGKTRFFHKYQRQYNGYIAAQKRAFKAGFKHRIVLDVQSFYLSIDHGILRSILRSRFGLKEGAEMDLLFRLLNKWSELSFDGDRQCNKRGLPQGYEASDLLANAYLSPIDVMMKEKFGKLARFFRYNDDMVVMLKNADSVNRVIAEITSDLLKLGLSINGKSECRIVENEDEFRSLSTVPYGEFEYGGVDKTLGYEGKAGDYLDRILAGEILEKAELSELRYYLRTGGIFYANYISRVIPLLFARPDLAFHAAEYLEWGADEKNVFDELWNGFQKRHHQLTDWQVYCLVRLLTMAGKHMSTYRRWDKLREALREKDGWSLRLFSIILKYGYGGGIDTADISASLVSSKSSIEAQYIVLVADQTATPFSTVTLVHETATSLEAITEIVSGERIIEPNDTPPDELAPVVTLIQGSSHDSEELDLLKDLQVRMISIQDLLTTQPLALGEKDQKRGFDFHQDTAFLYVQLGGKEVTFPKDEQNTHVFAYALEKKRAVGAKGILNTQVWEHLLEIDKSGILSTHPQDKGKKSVGKSVERHLVTIEKRLREHFTSLVDETIFRRESGGFIFEM